MRVIVAFCMALGMFTALPLPWRPWDESARGMMLTCLPLVGAVVGLLWAVLALLARVLLPAPLSAAVLAALPWLLTGFIHLDGFMDTSDALLSWRPLEDRLRILKDSRTGAYAVVNLGLLMLFSYAAAQSLERADLRALALIPVASRCASAFCVSTLPPLGHSEYHGMAGSLPQRAAILVMALAVMIAGGLWLGRGAVIVLAVETLAYALAMGWAAGTLKGVSGDLAGFALTLAEAAALMALAVVASHS